MVQYFRSGDVSLAFVDEGKGDPIVLIHGFASNLRVNWESTGWISALVSAGRRVIALDNRGHGKSDKPHEREAYGTPVMADDVIHLLDHLSISRADLMGYSMGARITAFAGLTHQRKSPVLCTERPGYWPGQGCRCAGADRRGIACTVARRCDERSGTHVQAVCRSDGQRQNRIGGVHQRLTPDTFAGGIVRNVLARSCRCRN